MQDALTDFQNLFARAETRALATFVAALVIAGILHLVLGRLLPRLTARTRSALDDRLLKAVRRPVFVSVLLIGTHLALLQLPFYELIQLLVRRLLTTVLILLWTGAGFRICSVVLDLMAHVAGRVEWLEERTIPLFDNLAKIVITGGAIYGLLTAWNLNIAPWLASAGIAGIAIGFAAKDTLANLFGGLFIIIDAPYKIGDFVNLDSGERGRVVKIGLRSTRLLTRDDVEITLPNAQIANSKIVNESGGPSETSRVSIMVGVAYGSDVDRVRQVLQGAVDSVDLVLDDPAPRIRFHEMADSALIFRVLCWIDRPVLRGQTIDALNTAVYRALNEAGISIPFPQREVHLRPLAGD